MAERQISKPEIAAQKKTIKLAPAIGDWTTYKPAKVLVKKVKAGLYGFDRLSRDELDLFLNIHYRFTEQFLKRLKIELKIAVELFSVSVEQTTYLNFLRTLTGQTVQSKIMIPGLHDAVSVFFDLSLANSIINHALGSGDLEQTNRGLTESENTVLSTAITEYLPKYSAAFENIFQNPSFSIIGSPDVTIDPSINTSETFVFFSAEFTLADNPPGRMLMGYLGSALKTLLGNYLHKTRQKAIDFSRLPSVLLSQVTAPAKILLGKTVLTTRELNEIEAGDVVSLDTAINSAIPLALGKNLKLLCQPGIKNKKISVRVASVGGEEMMEIAPPPLTAQEEKKEEPAPAEEEEILGTPEEKEEGEESFPEEEEFPEEQEQEENEFGEEETPEEEMEEDVLGEEEEISGEEEEEEMPEEETEEDVLGEEEEEFPEEEFPEEGQEETF